LGDTSAGDALTVAAVLTPPGVAAIAVIGIWGPEAWSLACRLLHGQQKLPDFARSAPLRRWVRLADPVDEKVLLYASLYKDWPLVELHCHGAPVLVRLLMDRLEMAGAGLVTWTQWLRRTASSPWQAQALVALPRARTLRTATVLLDQYQGALEHALDSIATALVQGRTADARRRVAELLHWAPVGQHLTEPWTVLLAGPPNTGKSTLLNALLGYQRAITSPLPGTTRDLVSGETALRGWPVRFVDSAGLRLDSADPLEREGMMRTCQEAGRSDMCLWVIDADGPPVPAAWASRALVVRNKIDLDPAAGPGWASFRVSALSGAGIADLLQGIVNVLVPAEPPPGTAVPFTSDLVTGLARVLDLLDAGQERLAQRTLAQLMTAACELPDATDP